MDKPIFTPGFVGVEEVLRPAGYHIVLVSAPDVAGEVQAIETLRSQQVDGFIFVSLSHCTSNEHLLQLQNDGFPVVLVNRCTDDLSFNLVNWGDREAARAATMHLLNLGHTRIGTITGPVERLPTRRSAVERYAGWVQALAEQGLPVRKEWVVDGEYSYEGGFRAIETLLATGRSGGELPGALFIANDAMAIAALKALHQAGVHVPQDIAIVTVGDPPTAAYTIPALTTFSLPTHEAGRMAANILLDWLAAAEAPIVQEGPVVQQVTLRFHPVVRESCGARTAGHA
ncbi:MAG: substrate-binding domain-containing protein [Ktedonobacteraceae bacterium]|nr:substrate-binding domain-containing protein [Ktedonobacteraceae bacterium]